MKYLVIHLMKDLVFLIVIVEIDDLIIVLKEIKKGIITVNEKKDFIVF